MIKRNTAYTLKTNPYIKYIIIGIALCLVPLLAEIGIIKVSALTILGGVIIYTFAALGLNILLGYSGLISLGTAGFMGLGAYLSAFFTENLHLPFLISLPIAVIIPVIIGVFIGFISLKVEGLYLAIATLCVSEILRKSFEELSSVTNGFAGKSSSYPDLFYVLKLDRNGTFILMVILLVIFMILTHNMANGYLGRAFLAMRGSEVAAQAMGINLLKYRLMAFALATMYSAISGVLYVHFIKYAYPATWNLSLSLSILAVIVIGGLRSIPGALLGALIVFGIPDLLLKQLPIIGDINGLSYIFNGILLIIIILFYPNGLVNIWEDIKKFLKVKDGKNA